MYNLKERNFRKGLSQINTIKGIFIHIRSIIKLLVLVVVSVILVGGIVSFAFKPIYSVTFKGEHIGYVNDKAKMQERINEYMKNGESEYVAFVDIEDLPTYTLCMLKKGIETNEEEVFNKVKETGTTFYRYFAVTEDSIEKAYLSTRDDAEKIIEELKTKNSTNKEKLGIIEKYETELKDFSTVEKVVADLYVKPVVVVAKTKTTSSSGGNAYASSVNKSGSKVDIGISLIRPVSGTVTSRFGARWGRMHSGIDIGAPSGRTIVAAAGGTVTTASYKGGYGNMVIINHGNGVQTCYAHCTKIFVSVGQKVSAGQSIATVGSTGNSTGPHLHLEVRKNGVSQNPQNYVY